MTLQRPDLAERALSAALGMDLSDRRRASVLTDLAMIGLQRRDIDQLIRYAQAAVEIAEQTSSGVVGRKLGWLQVQLAPMLGDRRVRNLEQELATLAATSVPMDG